MNENCPDRFRNIAEKYAVEIETNWRTATLSGTKAIILRAMQEAIVYTQRLLEIREDDLQRLRQQLEEAKEKAWKYDQLCK